MKKVKDMSRVEKTKRTKRINELIKFINNSLADLPQYIDDDYDEVDNALMTAEELASDLESLRDLLEEDEDE